MSQNVSDLSNFNLINNNPLSLQNETFFEPFKYLGNVFAFIASVFNSINFQFAASIFSNISLVLLGVVITIFVFTVTLLGKAARIAKEKKAEEEQKSNQGFITDIKSLEGSIKNNPKNIEELRKKLADIETKKKYTESTLEELDKKYNALGLKDAVLIPGVFFLLSIIFSNWIIFVSNNKIWCAFSFIISLCLLSIGILKIILTLKAVQYFSSCIKDDSVEQIQKAMVDALKTIEDEKEPKPFILFKEKPPFIFKANSEAKIEFEVDLNMPGNKQAKDVEILFLISPEIEFMDNSRYEKLLKQTANYTIPNANTVRYKLDLVKKHTKTEGVIKIKTTTAGKFKLRYKIDCIGHVEPTDASREVGIIVQD